MTCIVAIKTPDGFCFCGDGLATDGHHAFYTKNAKVWVQGEMILGACGSPRFSQLVRYGFTIPEHPVGMDTMTYLVDVFIEALRERLTKGEWAKDKEDVAAALIIGYRGCLIDMDSELSFSEPVADFCSVGSGRDVALGSLGTTARFAKRLKLTPQQRVEIALEEAATHCITVGGPFTTITV